MDFQSFARCHGVEIGNLRQGDKIYRCPTTGHPKSDNGAYYFDGRRGWVMSWEAGEGVQWWNDKNAQPWTDQEKREWAKRRREAEAAKAKGHADAAKRAAAMIALASKGNHPYLKEKGLPEAQCLVTEAGALLIPMRDFVTNALLGLQVIKLVDNEWEKKMLYGMRAKGAVLRIGQQRSPETFLVEGYATGLSVDAALRVTRLSASVLICFSATNIVHVAEGLSGRRFIFADNDVSKTGEKAAQATGLPYCMSDVVGEDANDLFINSGVMAVAKKLMEVRR